VFYRCSKRPVSVMPSHPSTKEYVNLSLSLRDEVAFPTPIMMPPKSTQDRNHKTVSG
jgi:hypothetical protein